MAARRPRLSRRRTVAGVLAVAAVATATVVAVGDSDDGSAASRPAPVVLAAASLTDVLPAIDRNARYSFAGSNALAAQVERGAPADVIASADAAITGRLYERGLVEKPVAFARNRLVVVVPRTNPGHVRSIADLARPGVSVDVADPAVPVGAYTLRALRTLHLATTVGANVVSRERDVRAVVAKIVLGQADAGVVYATDAKGVGSLVRVIPIPARAQPDAVYTAAVVTSARNADEARAYVRGLAGAKVRRTLARFGFLPAPAAAAATYT
jgi:molybdate transport system substrate-binding protein